MQEEVTQKTIALSVKTARVTADVLKNMLRKYLSGQKQKGTTTVYKLADGRYMDRIERIFIFDGVDTWTDINGAEWNQAVN